MLAQKQIKWTALATLVIGLSMAAASGWFDNEAVLSKDDGLAHSANAVSNRLFVVGSIFILITVLELQHARTTARMRQMENELASLKHSDGATA